MRIFLIFLFLLFLPVAAQPDDAGTKYFVAATRCYLNGDLVNAIQNYESSLAYYPSNRKISELLALAYAEKGVMDYTRGEYEKALYAVEKAFRLDPHNDVLKAMYTVCLESTLSVGSARVLGIEPLKSKPDVMSDLLNSFKAQQIALINEAGSLKGTGSLAGNEKLSRILLISIAGVMSLFIIFRIAISRRRHTAKTVVSVQSNYPDDASKFSEHFQRGVEAFKADRIDEAISEFNQSLQLHRDWETYQSLGTCYFKKGLKHQAMESFRRSLVLNPDNAELQQWLDGVRGSEVYGG